MSTRCRRNTSTAAAARPHRRRSSSRLSSSWRRGQCARARAARARPCERAVADTAAAAAVKAANKVLAEAGAADEAKVVLTPVKEPKKPQQPPGWFGGLALPPSAMPQVFLDDDDEEDEERRREEEDVYDDTERVRTEIPDGDDLFACASATATAAIPPRRRPLHRLRLLFHLCMGHHRAASRQHQPQDALQQQARWRRRRWWCRLQTLASKSGLPATAGHLPAVGPRRPFDHGGVHQ